MPHSRLTYFLPVFLLSAATVASSQAPPKEGTATVAGVIKIRGEIARGVSVSLQPSSTNSTQASRATSDENGRFRFDRVKAGRYSLYAVAPSYVTPGENRYGPQGQTINVSDGEKIENIELALTRGGIITGRVLDSRGNPIVGHSLLFARLNAQGKYESLFLGSNGRAYATDDRGIYRVFGLPAGRYIVGLGYEARPNSITVTSVRTYYPRTYHPEATTEAEAKPVEVNEGQETTGIDITIGALKKNYDVSGRVLFSDSNQPAVGVPISFGVLNAQSRNVGPWGSTNERTNADGEFRMQNILPGKYLVFAQPSQSENSVSESVPIEITDANVSGVEIKLRRGSSISGVAVIENVDPDANRLLLLTGIGLNVAITSPEIQTPSSARSGVAANGTFRLNGLRSGKARIQLETSTRNLSIIRVERDGVKQPDGIDVGEAEQISGVRVILSAGRGVIRGLVRTTGGAIPEGIRIVARVRHLGSGLTMSASSQVDPHHQFRIESLPSAEYEVFLSAVYLGDESPANLPDLNRLLTNTKSRVVVTNDTEAQVELTVDLSRRGNQ